MENCLPTHVSGSSGIYWLNDAQEVPDTQILTYQYPDFVLTWELRSFAKHHPIDGTLMIHGEGYDDSWSVTYKDGSPGPSASPENESEDGLHEKNFIECIKSREQPHADVEFGRLATTICHLGNICTHLRRDINFDPKSETFGHDKEANAYLTKKHREPYTLPKV